MNYHYSSILQGAAVTIGVALASLVIGTIVGLLGAAAKLSGRPFLVAPTNAYTFIIRGVPELILMLLVYYGGSIGINSLLELVGSKKTININPLVAGILSLGIIHGAYMTEVFRGAILAIPPGQREAALAFGMHPLQIFVRITLPQLVRYALPGFTNSWLALMKATAIVSLIGLQEMTYHTKLSAAATNSPFIFFVFSALIFLFFSWSSLKVLKRIGERYSVGVVRGTFQ